MISFVMLAAGGRIAALLIALAFMRQLDLSRLGRPARLLSFVALTQLLFLAIAPLLGALGGMLAIAIANRPSLARGPETVDALGLGMMSALVGRSLALPVTSLVLALFLASWLGWPDRVFASSGAGLGRWWIVPAVASASLLHWPIKVIAALLAIPLMVAMGEGMPGHSRLVTSLAGLMWLLAYALAFTVALKLWPGQPGKAGIKSVSDRDGLGSRWKAVGGITLLTGALGIGLERAVLQTTPLAMSMIGVLMSRGPFFLSAMDFSWRSVLMAWAPLLLLPLLGWPSIETRVGSALELRARVLIVLSLGQWITWPLTSLSGIAAMQSGLTNALEPIARTIPWAPLVGLLLVIGLLSRYRPSVE